MRRVVQMRLVVIQHDQCRGVEVGDLPGDLRTDRAAASGDEHPPPVEERLHGLEIDVDLLTPEQVVDAQVADVAQRGVTPDEVRETRHHLHGHASGGRAGSDTLHELRRRVGDCKQHLVHFALPHDAVQLVDAPEDRDAVQRASADLRVVVEDGDRRQAEMGITSHLSDRGTTAGACTHDGHAQPGTAVPRPPEGEQSRLEARGAHQDRREHRTDDHHGERDADRRDAADEHEDDG